MGYRWSHNRDIEPVSQCNAGPPFRAKTKDIDTFLSTLGDQEWHLNLVPDDIVHVFHLTAILQSSRASPRAVDSVRTSARNLQ